MPLDRMTHLSGIRSYERDALGGKGSGLLDLVHGDAPVPTTIAVPACIERSQYRELRELLRLHGSDNQLWAVRSSASNEDGANLSYAGQFETILNVPINDVWDAVEKVRASVANAESYRVQLDASSRPISMTVLVQKMIHPKYAGVLFIGDPYTRNPRGRILEYVNGLADKMVGGEVAPAQTIRWTTDNIAPIFSLPFEKEFLKLMASVHSVVYDYSGYDFEWAIDQDDKVWLLQKRQLTNVTWLSNNPMKALSGMGLGDFDPVTGPVHRMPGRKIRANEILVTSMTTPAMIDSMITAKAIVTRIGGLTCHAAIVARELGKPCIVGYAKAESLREGQIITVNSRTGEVSLA